jgi:DNA-binding IclR family transcriptional regulator
MCPVLQDNYVVPYAAQRMTGYRERNSTADRALQILDLFAEDRLVVGGTEVAAALSTSRSTAYRYLQSLVLAGFLEVDAAGGFRLGPRVLELSRLARKGFAVVDIARPVMRTLRDALGETVLLTRRSGDRVICLESEEARATVRISYERGSVLPLHAGASALVLLAWLPADEARAMLEAADLQPLTENTLTEVDAVLARLERIRHDGVAVSRGELDHDVTGVAAPIRAASGEITAALSVAALNRRVPGDRLDAVAQAVRQAAAEVERALVAD